MVASSAPSTTLAIGAGTGRIARSSVWSVVVELLDECSGHRVRADGPLLGDPPGPASAPVGRAAVAAVAAVGPDVRAVPSAPPLPHVHAGRMR